jgi:hypothetical protein
VDNSVDVDAIRTATVLVTSGAVLWQHARMMVAAPAL